MSKNNIKKSISYNKYGYFFVAPFVIIFLIFSLWPIINTIWLSFTDTVTMRPNDGKWIGLKNFDNLFSNFSDFPDSIKTTWKIWILNFIPQMVLAMLIAVWYTSQRMKIKCIGFFRSIFYLPNMLMPATVAAMYGLFFGFNGPISQLLYKLGFESAAGINYMTKPKIVMWLVVFIQTWMWFGQTLIVIMAGMTSISHSLYESAMIDGASSSRMFRSITLPCLKPVLVYTLVTSLVGGLQMFDIPYMITGNVVGGPQNCVKTMNVVMVTKKSQALGSAASVGVFILLMTGIVSCLIFYVLRDKDKDKHPKIKSYKDSRAYKQYIGG